MNPTMADEEQAYNAGLMEGIRLIGEGGRAPARGRGADSLHLRGAQASQCAGGRYSPEPAGAGVHGQPRSEYLWRWQIHRADDGARRGAERGGRQRKRRPPVSLEQVLEWNPQVIFVRGPLSAGGQTDRERPAVAGDRCGETSPRVADAGVCQSPGLPDAGGPGAGRAVDGEKLYPARYQSIDVDSKARDYYQRFYRVAWMPDAR